MGREFPDGSEKGEGLVDVDTSRTDLRPATDLGDTVERGSRLEQISGAPATKGMEGPCTRGGHRKTKERNGKAQESADMRKGAKAHRDEAKKKRSPRNGQGAGQRRPRTQGSQYGKNPWNEEETK